MAAPLFFKNTEEFRTWLDENHQKEKEVLVGYYKIATGKPNMSWSESVDEALCFGWIDGIRKSVDDESYCIRFTQRKAKSTWSEININKVKELIRQGRMRPAGLAAYEKRAEARTEGYSYENKPEQFSPELETRFRGNREAWEFFSNQSASYKKTIMFYVMGAKQEATRYSRLDKLMQACMEGKRMY